MKSWSVTIQAKATEQYFPVVLYTKQTLGSPLNETSMYYYYGNVTFLQDKICDFLNFSLGTLKFCYCVLNSKDYSSSCIIPTRCVFAYQVTALLV